MLNRRLGRGRIAEWFKSLTPGGQLDHVRRAGRRRWVNATAYDRARAAARLRKFRISRREAIRRLERAWVALARKREQQIAPRPRLR
jgi:hypothetical protein